MKRRDFLKCVGKTICGIWAAVIGLNKAKGGLLTKTDCKNLSDSYIYGSTPLAIDNTNDVLRHALITVIEKKILELHNRFNMKPWCIYLSPRAFKLLYGCELKKADFRGWPAYKVEGLGIDENGNNTSIVALLGIGWDGFNNEIIMYISE